MKIFEKFSDFKKSHKDITILYPGGFKPLTGAHIDIINRYLEHPKVKKTVLFISPSKREEINAEDAYIIAKKLLNKKSVEIILDKDSYSPILACYRWIEKKERTPGKYAMAASTKGNDYKRVKEFTSKYNEKYKDNLGKGIEIVELPIDVNPLTKENGEPISASEVREDIRNNDFKNFKTNYPNLNINDIKYIWNKLSKSKVEDIEEAGLENFTISKGTSGYEEIYPSQKYKSHKNVY